jgi:hypothetical protein
MWVILDGKDKAAFIEEIEAMHRLSWGDRCRWMVIWFLFVVFEAGLAVAAARLTVWLIFHTR